MRTKQPKKPKTQILSDEVLIGLIVGLVVTFILMFVHSIWTHV
jgi:hypothetical protein